MTYLVQSQIADNFSMKTRVAQCAAQEGIADADEWTAENARIWAAAPGWDAAWASAEATHEDDKDSYDPGADEAVITDQMILGQVQKMHTVTPA
jgi:hypothetical protein